MDVLRGTLDLMILKALAAGRRHGWGLTQWIRQTTDDALQVEDGALYPALRRLEDRNWIRAEWGTSENNRRARYYELTAKGRRQLERELATWARFSEALGKIVDSGRG
jgi:transcriptional regulator